VYNVRVKKTAIIRLIMVLQLENNSEDGVFYRENDENDYVKIICKKGKNFLIYNNIKVKYFIINK